MKLKHILLGTVLIFTLWFVSTMYFNQESFNYYEKPPKEATFNNTFLKNKSLPESKAEMFTNMKSEFPIHYFLLKNQVLIFLLICLLCIPYKKIYKFLKK